MANFLTGFVAVLHIGFLILEMFLWQKPLGLKIFHMDATTAHKTAVLAKNQGLYNGFLAAGLIWSFFVPFAIPLRIFFLTCIIVAGVYGALTAKSSILYIQALPALLALIAVMLLQV